MKWTCAGVLALAACAVAVTRDQFYTYGPGLDAKLSRGNSVPSPEIFLKVPVLFYGETYETVFVNNFGVLSFRADIPTFMNTEFPLPYPSIAAFYSNVDTTEEGAVYYRETNEPHVLAKAEESVQDNFHEYFDFKPTSVFIATWIDVTYTTTVRDRKNSFQIAIISNGTESFVEFLYPEREIQWIRAETLPNTPPDAYAQAGFVAEDGRLFTLRGSGSHQIRNIVSWSNTQEPGKYVYRIGNIPLDGNVAVPDQYNQNEVEVEEESKTCAQSGPSVCHLQAKCVDYQAGICCQCNEGYYGNGKSCIRNDTPLRVHGKLNGVINDIHLNDVNIQAYVIVAEGRTYTALALAPPSLGRSLELLQVLGGVVGWLFAKPSGSGKNGYQLTGSVFNHTADVWFPTTNDRVTIHQEYLGHDVFDQIVIETDVRGTLPVITTGNKLEVGEYDEQYTIVSNGLIRSEATRTLTNKETGEKYEQRISQTFSYTPCSFAPQTEEATLPLTLKVSKNYLGYEANENIVRYGSSNKLAPLGQEDPCVKGQESCGSHSTCVVQGDSFTCVCQTGYTNIYKDDILVCIDFDECTAGTHNCDPNADCYNHEGGFQCRCKEGFEGNGVNCSPPTSCKDRKCDVNAQCVDSAEGPICVCNTGYTGDGRWCWQIPEYACSSCSPYASCAFSPTTNGYICQCNPGYHGNGHYCELEETPTPYYSSEASPTPNSEYACSSCSPYASCAFSPSIQDYICRCNRGYYGNGYYCELEETSSPYYTSEASPTPDSVSGSPGYVNPTYPYPSSNYQEPTTPSPREAEYNETFVLPNCDYSGCTCPSGYTSFRDERNNELCRIDNYNVPTQATDTDSLISCESDTDCPPNAACSYIPDSKGQLVSGRCVCPEGYEGDAYECIERTGPNCSCGLNAHCLESVSPGELLCVCDSGYHGDGYTCRPNFSCTNNSDCEYNAECKPNPISNELICQCIDGYVKDQNDACIPRQLCNGALCADHASCLYDDTIYVSFCGCDEGYEGDGITQCVPAGGHGCNFANDCSPDALCTVVDNSYQCVCREGYTGDGYTCTYEQSCRTNPYLCSVQASCLKRSDGYVCECNTGYNGNGTHCELNPRLSGNFLVVSEGATIYRVPFDTSPKDYPKPLNSGIDQIAVGLDVDCVSGRVYWGDVVGNTIKRIAYDGSGFETFLRTGVISPEGIAIDWSARNVFWTDSKKLTIEVANMETKARKVLFAVDSISNPRGIAVHPQRGKIFWSDWKRASPKIEWANMDGSQRGIFLDSSDVELPNSLAIDWVRERLCYADAGQHQLNIKCVGIDTLERNTIASSCLHPFSLAVNGDQFYWTDWRTRRIEYADTSNQLRGQLPVAITSRPYGLAVAPDQCPGMNSVCTHRNGGCAPDQLCLPNGQGGRTCVDGDHTYQEK